jgi:hypothetical protein
MKETDYKFRGGDTGGTEDSDWTSKPRCTNEGSDEEEVQV